MRWQIRVFARCTCNLVGSVTNLEPRSNIHIACMKGSSGTYRAFSDILSKSACNSRAVQSGTNIFCTIFIRVVFIEYLSLCIRSVSSESSLGAFWIDKDVKLFSCGQRRLRSDCADAQSDRSLHWAYMLEDTFYHAEANLFPHVHMLLRVFAGRRVYKSPFTLFLVSGRYGKEISVHTS